MIPPLVILRSAKIEQELKVPNFEKSYLNKKDTFAKCLQE
jgi:hypothetical protein